MVTRTVAAEATTVGDGVGAAVGSGVGEAVKLGTTVSFGAALQEAVNNTPNRTTTNRVLLEVFTSESEVDRVHCCYVVRLNGALVVGRISCRGARAHCVEGIPIGAGGI